MPTPMIVARAVTDRNGRFSVTIASSGGDLDIELIDDRCAWRGGYKLIRQEEVNSSMFVEVVAVPDVCD